MRRPWSKDPHRHERRFTKIVMKQEGFLRCQTPTSTLRQKVEGCRLDNGGCRIMSVERRGGSEIFNLILLVTQGCRQNFRTLGKSPIGPREVCATSGAT